MYVQVHVDPEDILDQLDADALERALKNRRQNIPTFVDEAQELVEAALVAVRAHDFAEAEFLLERALFPKFKSFDNAMFAYAQARKAAAS